MQGGREDTTEGMMRIGRIRAVEVAIFGAGLGGMGEALIVGGLLMTAIPTTTSIILGAVPPIAAVVFPKILGGHGSWLSNQVAVVELQHKGTYPLKPPSIGKNVSFASPIATVLGGHNSSVMCEERQNSVARVGSAASPPTMMEVDGSNLSANTAALEPSLLLSELVQHFDQPLSKGKIEAIKNLLENGKQLKKKARGTKVAPAVLACPSALG